MWDTYGFTGKNQKEDIDDNENNDDSEDKDYENVGQRIKFPNETISTPVGAMLCCDGWNPLQDRNIYVANVDFVLTTLHIKMISSILGVEHIHVISPYSFSLITGVMFDGEEVIFKIEDALGITYEEDSYIDEDSPLYDIISPVIRKLLNKKHWMLYVLPNGKHIERTYENTEDFYADRKKFRGRDGEDDFIEFTAGIYFDSDTEIED